MEALQAWLDGVRQARPQAEIESLFVPIAFRRKYWLSQALQSALRDAALWISEESVASVKLRWWSEELGRFDQGKASHPLLQAPELHIDRVPLGKQLTQLLQAFSALRALDTVDSPERLLAAVDAVAVAGSGLEQALGVDQGQGHANGALTADAMMDALGQLAAHLAHGRYWIPASIAARCQCSRAELQQSQWLQGEAGTRLTQAWVEAMVFRALDPQAASSRLSRVRLALLQRRARAIMRRPGAKTLLLPFRPGPVDLFVAWRAARGA